MYKIIEYYICMHVHVNKVTVDRILYPSMIYSYAVFSEKHSSV